MATWMRNRVLLNYTNGKPRSKPKRHFVQKSNINCKQETM